MDHSNVSQGEMIQLYSSFVLMTTDALNCDKTLDRVDKESTIQQHNCDYRYKRQIFELDNIVWNSCLCRFKHPNFNQLLILSKHYEKGNLPNSGAILDQNAKLIEKLEILEHLKNLHQDQQQKEQERKSNGRSQHRPPAESRKRPTGPSTGSGPGK